MNPKSILLSILKAGKKIEKKQEKIRKFTWAERTARKTFIKKRGLYALP